MKLRSVRTASLALAALLTLPLVPLIAQAHDTWVQTNTNLIRVGDAVHIDLMLGNHGNEHRDFKLASKIDVAATTMMVVAPDGKKYDLKDRLIDTGYTPKEGYWTAPFAADKPGLYTIANTSDMVVSYAPERAIKSAKSYFVASESLDHPRTDNPGFDKPLGHPLELVPLVNPVTPMGPGTPLKVRLLYKGKPLANSYIACIPRGAQIKEGAVDERYEKTTDANGEVTFEPKEANYYLVVAHKQEKEEGGTLNGKPYQFTNYGATLTVYVPQICPCCGG
jgi:uncharacterized GH25 family protein